MPRSLEDIIEHADELADMCERLNPDDMQEIPVADYLLQRAALTRVRAERELLDAVARAREDGVPWTRIGEIVGTSGQAAQQRYGRAIRRAPRQERPGA